MHIQVLRDGDDLTLVLDGQEFPLTLDNAYDLHQCLSDSLEFDDVDDLDSVDLDDGDDLESDLDLLDSGIGLDNDEDELSDEDDDELDEEFDVDDESLDDCE